MRTVTHHGQGNALDTAWQWSAWKAARLLVLVGFAAAFMRAADPERLAEALLALRVPYPAAFAFVTGARWVPLAAREIAELRDGARARGIGTGGRVDGGARV